MKTDFDVIVAGGGPAGGMAAYTAAEAGLRTLLLEKEKLPRYKTCGGGLVTRAADILPFDISDIADRELNQIRIVENKLDLEFFISSDKPVIRMVMRDAFDNYLLEKAVRRGCEIRDAADIAGIGLSDNSVSVETTAGRFTGNYLVAADGALGFTNRHFGLNKKMFKIPALEYEVYSDAAALNRFFSEARFDFGIIPNGYGWIFPKKDHLSIGIASMSKRKLNLKIFLSNYLSGLGLPSNLKIEKHGFVIPFTHSGKTFTKLDRVFFCGDSAGLADPVTAEGISNALLSGKIAGESISRNFEQPTTAAKVYNEKISSGIIRELKFARRLSSVFYNHNFLRSYLLRNHGQRMAELMGDVVGGKVKYSELLTDSSNYLKLLKPSS